VGGEWNIIAAERGEGIREQSSTVHQHVGVHRQNTAGNSKKKQVTVGNSR
jgi:hypothetical protein